jgi:2-oxoglutarate ferredoxin oxidoreductase subunit beta
MNQHVRTAKAYATDQEVRWCPGCGDYAILRAVHKTLADVEADPARTVFVSGIGCSSRFPYYVATYGFHTIHGRAPAIATGLKLARPELDVWIVTGDGDGLSIGGNHLLHLLRRNPDVQVLLFNNEIYGLTKGQYSPTSALGARTPSTPLGSLERPLSPARFVLGAGGRFLARSVDTAQKHLPAILRRAREFKGAAFVELFQNCIVYNDGVFAEFTDKAVAADRQLLVEHGRPLRFGANGEKGLRLDPARMRLEVVTVGENGIGEADIAVHDETNAALAWLLAGLTPPHEPVAIGVLYADPAPAYEEAVHAQLAAAGQGAGAADQGLAALRELFERKSRWRVG